MTSRLKVGLGFTNRNLGLPHPIRAAVQIGDLESQPPRKGRAGPIWRVTWLSCFGLGFAGLAMVRAPWEGWPTWNGFAKYETEGGALSVCDAWGRGSPGEGDTRGKSGAAKAPVL